MNISLRRRTRIRAASLRLLLLALAPILGSLTLPSFANAQALLRIDTTHRVFDSTHVRVTRTAYDTIRVTNGGTTALTIDSVVLSGATANQYAVVRVPDTAIAAGHSDYIAVSFSPTTTGTLRDSLTIFSNGGTAGRTVTGIGVIPAISISTDLVDFDSVRIGEQTCRPITITNTGTDTLAITRNMLIDSTHSYYYYSLDATDSLIAPGKSRDIGVCFLPTATGVFNSQIAVRTDIPGDTTTRYINVTGIGVRASGFTPGALGITSAIIGTSTCTMDTLRSTGGENNIIISRIQVTGADSSAVMLTTPMLPDTVMADSMFIYNLCVNPTHRGPLNASVAITYTSLGLTQTANIPLTINGLLVCAQTNTMTAFTNRTLLSSTDTARITVTNCGDVPTAYHAALTGSSLAYRIYGSDTTSVVQPNSSTSFTVLYTPTSIAVDTGMLRITGGNGVAPMDVLLLGSGGTVAIAALDTVPDVMVGNCQDFPVRLHNTGNMTWTSGNVQIIGTSAADYSIKSFNSLTIGPDSIVTVTVTFCPKSATTETATLTFPTAAPNVATQITLIGRGVTSGVEEGNAASAMSLSGIYPNPASATATVNYYLPIASDIQLQLVDSRGAVVRTLFAGRVNDGAHEITVNTKSLDNGTYFVILNAAGKQLLKQITVLH